MRKLDFMAHMPIFKKLIDISNDLKTNLAGWHCIYAQHILESNVYCVDFLIYLGLRRSNILVLGKGYSTSYSALSKYNDRYVRAINAGKLYSYKRPFDEYLIKVARLQIRKLLKSGAEKILLLDEGGILSRALSGINISKAVKIVCVELTSRGQNYYHRIQNYTTLVDVARSYGKKKVEAPVIAMSMVDFIIKYLEISVYIERRNFLIIGVGAIGGAILDILQKSNFNVIGYDIVNNGDNQDKLRENIELSDIILSSTGCGIDLEKIINYSYGRKLFINCGSSDIEFNLWSILSRKNYKWTFGDIPVISNNILHRDIKIETNIGLITIAHGGFPINFDGSPDPIPINKIQITRSLLLLGAIQGINTKSIGICELSIEHQNDLCRLYEEKS